ncbi:class I SAM-dependent methyltransferase [Trueperella pyogenes]|uniref:class I SAM-dependent methyltransferase n=1 Tax=Trueperella pyogenes TaxID=1661 RepID=UPI0021680672|nr:class I SAM-dependent methyltransferase [Trueperella pyogenes]UVJ55809.1 methyltransferase domain-containing protein [Trueperella pyogenes]
MLNPEVDLDGMNSYIYGQEWSQLWQRYFSERPTTQASADFLASLIPHGRALEIGVGSGRVAIPLSERGVKVTGLDTSAHMLRYLEEKDTQHSIDAVLDDAQSFNLPRKNFDLVYFISWGLHMLLTDEAQQNCFDRASAHLACGGYFVVELMRPEGYPFGGTGLNVLKIDKGSVIAAGEMHDPQQRILLNAYLMFNDGETPRIHTSASHYCSTEQLDEMASHSGMKLHQAYETWDGSPIVDDSPTMIRVYRKGCDG